MDDSTKRFFDTVINELYKHVTPADIRVDMFRSNTGDATVDPFESTAPENAAIRITHITTGTVVQCAEFNTRMQNHVVAMLKLLAEIKD